MPTFSFFCMFHTLAVQKIIGDLGDEEDGDCHQHGYKYFFDQIATYTQLQHMHVIVGVVTLIYVLCRSGIKIESSDQSTF